MMDPLLDLLRYLLLTMVGVFAAQTATIALQLVLLRRTGQLMASEQDLQDDMDAIKALVQKQADAIAALAAGQTVSQAQLDALDAEAKAILGTTPTPPAA